MLVCIMTDARYGGQVLADECTEYSGSCSVKDTNAVHADKVRLDYKAPVAAAIMLLMIAMMANETYTRASAKAKQLEEQHRLNRDSGLEFNKAVI